MNLNVGHDFFEFRSKIDETFSEYEIFDNPAVRKVALFLPSLEKRIFTFRNDVVVYDTTHKLLTADEESYASILGIRDPRDMMLSLFRWQNRGEIFFEFCVNNIAEWVNFYEKCLKYKNTKIFRFEDRKRNEALLLKELVAFLSLEFSDYEINEAVTKSSLENAKSFEKDIIKSGNDFYKNNSAFRIVESGELNKYKLPENAHHQKAFQFIVKQTASTMRKYGYTSEQIYGDKIHNTEQLRNIFLNA
jgi:hypothetical protein